MAKLTTKQRKALPKGSFAIPGKAPGSGSYPVNDISHARNALARASQHGSPEVRAAVRRKVKVRFPSIKQNPMKMKGTPLSSFGPKK